MHAYSHCSCRSMQHIVIRKRCEDLHAAIEAAATDKDIAKLARVAYQASASPHKILQFPMHNLLVSPRMNTHNEWVCHNGYATRSPPNSYLPIQSCTHGILVCSLWQKVTMHRKFSIKFT